MTKPTRTFRCLLLVVGACLVRRSLPRFAQTVALVIGVGGLQAILRAAEPTTASAPTPATPTAPAIPTIIESAGPAVMVSTATESTFTFRDQVVVTATNLKITCDNLVAVALRTGDPKAIVGKQEKFKSLIATGNVHIVQGNREAYCGRAEVLPA